MFLQHVFKSLQKMNSDAVCLLLEGQPEDALAKLSHCATAVKSVLLDYTSSSSSSSIHNLSSMLPVSNNNSHYSCYRKKSSLSLNLYAVSLDEVIYPCDASERVVPDNSFKLHRFVYMLNGDASSPDLSTIRVLLATVLYNMAAISHESVQGGLGLHTHILEKARSFYELAIAMLSMDEHAVFKPSAAVMIDTMPLKLALTNNLGHLHAIFYNRDGAVPCRHELNNLLSMVDREKLLTGEYNVFEQVPAFLARNHMSKAPAA